MEKKVRACCRINETLHQRLHKTAKENNLSIGVAMRRMLMLGLDTYDEKMGKNVDENVAKRKLLRAERFAIFATALQFIHTMDTVSPEELVQLEKRTHALLEKRWEFGDDNYLSNLSQKAQKADAIS